MLDKNLIFDFRDQINSNDWALFHYRKNRDRWGCICSAMDWIDVSVDYLNCHPLSSNGGNQSIEFFSCIACVDILVEAIEQLHRVIFSTPKRVFQHDNDCFPNNPFKMDDRDFFKTLRACFGTHPVNLDDPFHPKSKKQKRFASWSGGFVGPGDFSVILYSNRLNKSNITLGIKYSEIESFAKKYYYYLPQLSTQLDQQYKDFCNEMQHTSFECTGTPIKRLRILQKESKKRLNNEYYNCTIEELIDIRKTRITCKDNKKMANQYFEFLDRVIDEIYFNLQNMTLIDLKNDRTPYEYHLPLPNGWMYWVGKLSEVRSGYGYPLGLLVKEIERIFGNCFVFDYKDIQELYVLVKASLYQLSLKKEKMLLP